MKRNQDGASVVENRVAEYRTRRGMPRQELAYRVGLNPSSVSVVERGEYLPSVELALKISAVLNTPVEKLFLLPRSWLMGEPARCFHFDGEWAEEPGPEGPRGLPPLTANEARKLLRRILDDLGDDLPVKWDFGVEQAELDEYYVAICPRLDLEWPIESWDIWLERKEHILSGQSA